MAKGPSSRVRVAALILAFVGAVLVIAPAHAQSYVGYVESPADALARNIKQLATSPKKFDALIGAGRAALALGDTQAAAGFFGRAEEVWPSSPLPQAGMGAALAHDGDPRGALQYFARAVQRGATPSMIGADRGLAYDLLGQHAQAQADYRAALVGRDVDEARRRLAMSLAITGNRAEALSTLSPLLARGDSAAARCRAFVLALTGDPAGAKAALDARMPGSAASMAYFFHRLPSLRSDQKAAAVNLGIFPDAATQHASTASPLAAQPEQDRIGAIERWLTQTPSQATAPRAAPPAATAQPQPTEVAAVSLPRNLRSAQIASASDAAAAPAKSRRYWLQLASGSNAAALPRQFERIKSRNRDLFEGISGYVAEDGGRARLLIGPFRSASDADVFAEDLGSVRIDAFQWISQPGQPVRKLSAE